jgi:EmrB/QacA subfamily drug resistance transporter
MAATTATARAARRRWRWVLLSTGLGSWLVTASLSTINVAFPELQARFSGYSLRSLSWVVTSYTITFGALLIPSGRIADRFGRRLVFNHGLGLFAIGALLSATAPTLAVVIVGRVLQGVGGAVIVPASLGLLLEASEDRDRLRSVTMWSASNTIGGASGPTLGALVVDAGGWRGTFAFAAVAAAVTFLIGRRHLPTGAPSAERVPIDAFGVLLIALVMAVITLAVSQGNEWGWSSGAVVGLFIAAALATVAVVQRSRRHPQPILPLDLFRHRMFSVSIVALTVFGIAGGGMQLLNVLFLRNVWDYSALEAGIAVTPAPAFATLCAPLSGRLGQRFGPRALSVPGAAVLAVGVGWYLTQLGGEPSYWIDFFPGAALTGIGVSMVFPMLSAAAVHDADPPRLSLASGAARTANQLGTAIGISLLFALLGDAPDSLDHFRDGWRLLLVMTIAAGAIAMLLAPRRRVRSAPDQAGVVTS